MLSATLGMSPVSSPVSSQVSSLQILNISLAIYFYPLSSFAFNAHAMGCLGGDGTVTGNDTQEIAEAHLVQCGINDVVNVYMSFIHMQTVYLHV